MGKQKSLPEVTPPGELGRQEVGGGPCEAQARGPGPGPSSPTSETPTVSSWRGRGPSSQEHLLAPDAKGPYVEEMEWGEGERRGRTRSPGEETPKENTRILHLGSNPSLPCSSLSSVDIRFASHPCSNSQLPGTVFWAIPPFVAPFPRPQWAGSPVLPPPNPQLPSLPSLSLSLSLFTSITLASVDLTRKQPPEFNSMALYSHLDQLGAGRGCEMMGKEGRDAWPPRVMEGGKEERKSY